MGFGVAEGHHPEPLHSLNVQYEWSKFQELLDKLVGSQGERERTASSTGATEALNGAWVFQK